MKRRDFLKISGFATAGMAVSPLLSEDRRKPNILFIMADDLGREWISSYGGEKISTPNIDKLAQDGLRFTNAYSMPVCTPTRATLLTGQYPFRHGWCGHWDVPRWGAGGHFDWKHNLTFARVMKSAGYATAAAGKWQINDFRVQPDAMLEHGFDECCMWTGFESQHPPSAERYWDAYIHTREGSRTYAGQFGTDVFLDFLIHFMRRHKEEPMMLYFPMCLPHKPLVHTPLEPDADSDEERYEAMVRYVDHAVGRLTKELDDLGLRDNTIIIFTSDNGSDRSITGRLNGREVRGGKNSYGENGVRAPFIANCPGLIPSGAETEALTDFTDLFPTFAELGGATLPEKVTLDGRSIARLILGKENDSSREWIMAMGAGMMRRTSEGVGSKTPFSDRVVRDKRYKLWVTGGKSARLFDLTADPAEAHNLIDSKDPKIVAARRKLEAVVKSFPKQDARPRYDPTPPQPWDKLT
ncbi:MAG: sulfatase-like hydrolase/transferase [Acidobacteriota bacterium]